MSAATRYRQLASGPRSVGFELETPSSVEVHAGDAALRVREQRDGKAIGELAVEVFQAALVIDRDGILEEKVHEAACSATEPPARIAPAVPVELPGASGFRADAETVRPMGTPAPALPYVYVFAVASHDLRVDGGVLVTVRSASPQWPVADFVLQSLRLLDRAGRVALGSTPALPALPMIGKND
jgi:hypothetical protein